MNTLEPATALRRQYYASPFAISTEYHPTPSAPSIALRHQHTLYSGPAGLFPPRANKWTWLVEEGDVKRPPAQRGAAVEAPVPVTSAQSSLQRHEYPE
eukprot:1253598-Rhodomonas_salina.1